ncbi:winged helix-turn-helix domain-containing protein [Candidatus Halocynthiibacter alkanivorans]|uniref:winged helix-turn-helix domain-containing protein n=1 Tax=Candidatus Halocynthiibacter alkanivorans TaxID=2267619 RepID=UPI000DF42145|nr:crosslink repair DNA glycosylase YcaQ family protein [Candidatus Halocynthiibacter alkanivorans]
MALKIDNRAARRLFIAAQGLGLNPTGALDVMAMIRQLGFVQLDTIRVLERAHHHILWSRNQNYRPHMLQAVMGGADGIFEHFTHDASVIPMAYLPMWQRQFRRKKQRIDNAGWYKSMLDAAGRDRIKSRIRDEGPLCTRDFDTKLEGTREMWARPPHKLALDYMWYSGELATCHRVNFTKFYNLGERVFPAGLREQEVADQDQVDWLCRNALQRLGFASCGEVQRFWEAMSAQEARRWIGTAPDLVPVEVEAADGSWAAALAPGDIETRLAAAPAPPGRLRIINPFDPLIRDRVRLKRLFGIDYRVEMFVPAAKRQWGYYVCPLLEGDRFVGRIDLKAERAEGQLKVRKLWAEPGVAWGAGRRARLDAELQRMALFLGVDDVHWECSDLVPA